ncbi:FMN-binding negative transcriptional regulator [Pseudozobellia sp. WGM2]|uniref:FMN-binding negative transcriptional regulator n=1 Tax=Pseudozobellia sp. WGM2 TaxID=2787625 RepID=UPI001ADFAECE|nr:FMN-binding negative transcriptional regulator [Pseudozobellia sp. WGM2]
MYVPDYQRNVNFEEIKQFLKEHSFGILVTYSKGRSHATHIPLELEQNEQGQNVLTGHIAKANPQWKQFSSEEEVLCIFNGANAYISSSWYKEEEVPTWNYIAVHVYGKLSVLSEEEVMASLHRLVDTYEKSSKKPVSLKNMSERILKQVKGVVGFQIEITDIQARYKLSQNREQDHAKIISELEELDDEGSRAIAKEMKKSR